MYLMSDMSELSDPRPRVIHRISTGRVGGGIAPPDPLSLALVSADSVAVGAHYLALANLRSDGGPATVAAHHICHVANLDPAHMVKLQTARVSHATVSAAEGSLVNTNCAKLDSAEEITARVAVHGDPFG